MAVDTLFDKFYLFAKTFSGKPDREVKSFCNRYRNHLTGTLSAEELAYQLRISHSCRDADSLEVSGKFINPLQRNGELTAAFGCGKLMDFIHNDIADAGKVFSKHLSHEHRLNAFRSCNQQVRRMRCLFSPVVLRGVSVADRDTNSKLLSPPFQAVHHVAVQ